MFCTNCGHEIAEGSAFCTNCGKPVAQASPVPAPAPAEPSVSEQPEPVVPPAESSIPPVSPAEPPAPQAETPAPEPSEPEVVAPQDGPAVDDAPTTCLAADDGAGETPAAEPAPSEPAPFQAEPPALPPVDNSPQVEPAFSPDTAATQQVPAWQQGASDVQPQPVPWSAQQPDATMPGVSVGETQVAPVRLPLLVPCPVPCRGKRMLRPALLRQKLPPRPICSTSSRRRSALRARRWGSRLPCSPCRGALRGGVLRLHDVLLNEPGRNHCRGS